MRRLEQRIIELSGLCSLLERTRKEFLAATDPTFIHHAEYSEKLPKVNAIGAVYKKLRMVGKGRERRWEAVFMTGSASVPGRTYTQRVVLADLDALLRARKSDLTFKEKVMHAVNNGDLKIVCNCPAHSFWGYKYINTSLGLQPPGAIENRAPNIRNPQLRGIMCKHAQLCLEVLPFNVSSITGDVKAKLSGLSDFIFPEQPKFSKQEKPKGKRRREGMVRLAACLY